MLLHAILAAHAAGPLPHAPDPDVVPCGLSQVELAMVGDTMMHGMQLRAAHQGEGSYSLDGVFDPIEPWLAGADLAIANLETVIGGPDLGFTGYPRFNSPDALLDALQDAGVDVLQTANNHCLDRGGVGLQRTLDAVDARGLARAGTWRTPAERARPYALVELDRGLVVAFLGYTFSTNGLPRPEPWQVGMLRDGFLEVDVARARTEADLVVVGIHWGKEYRHQPEPEARALARRLVDAGADVVMGSHPHVLQPMEILQATDAAGRTRDAVVLYSLGNFVSNQRRRGRSGAAVARVEALWCPSWGRAWVSDVRFTPLWVDDRDRLGRLAYRVLPTPPAGVEECTDPHLSRRDCKQILWHRDHVADILGPERLDWDAAVPTERVLGFDPWGTVAAFRYVP